MKFLGFLVILFVSGHCGFGQDTLTIDSPGVKLRAFYLSLGVETRWLPGHHINWQTGEIDDTLATTGNKTHCSRFAAAACKKLGLYILQPVDIGKGSLANAQFTWLHSPAARDSGWTEIKNDYFYNAQQLANKGFVVVIVYKNPIPKKSGHIAFVLPAITSTLKLTENGPAIIQAGRINSSSITFYTGFEHHIKSRCLKPDEFAFFYNTHKAN